jgi:MOSC domain
VQLDQSLLTTATLDRLRELYPQGRFEVRRFQPNIVVASTDGATGLIDDAWVGRTVRIGDGVQLHFTGPCPRCVMTTWAEADLPNDSGILRSAAQPGQRAGLRLGPAKAARPPAVTGSTAPPRHSGQVSPRWACLENDGCRTTDTPMTSADPPGDCIVVSIRAYSAGWGHEIKAGSSDESPPLSCTRSDPHQQRPPR